MEQFEYWYSPKDVSGEAKKGITEFKSYLNKREMFEKIKFYMVDQFKDFTLNAYSFHSNIENKLFFSIYTFNSKTIRFEIKTEFFNSSFQYSLENKILYIISLQTSIDIVIYDKKESAILLRYRLSSSKIETLNFIHTYNKHPNKDYFFEIYNTKGINALIEDVVELKGGKIKGTTYYIRNPSRNTSTSPIKRTIGEKKKWELKKHLRKKMEEKVNRVSKQMEKANIVSNLLFSNKTIDLRRIKDYFGDDEILNIVNTYIEKDNNLKEKTEQILERENLFTQAEVYTHLFESFANLMLKKGIKTQDGKKYLDSLANKYREPSPKFAEQGLLVNIKGFLNIYMELDKEDDHIEYNKLPFNRSELSDSCPILFFGIERYNLYIRYLHKIRKAIKKTKYIKNKEYQKIDKISLEDFKRLCSPYKLKKCLKYNPFPLKYFSEEIKEKTPKE